MFDNLSDFIDPLDDNEERQRAILEECDRRFLDALNPQRVRDREAAASAEREKHLAEVRQRAADYRARRQETQRQPLPLGPISERIIKLVASYFALTPQDILGRRRFNYIVTARFVAIRLLRDLKFEDGRPRFSYPQIGRLVGGRDHATILHAIRSYDDRAQKYPEMLEAYAFVKGALDG